MTQHLLILFSEKQLINSRFLCLSHESSFRIYRNGATAAEDVETNDFFKKELPELTIERDAMNQTASMYVLEMKQTS